MRQELFLTLVLLFAVATQTISAEEEISKVLKRAAVLCPIIGKIPLVGNLIGSALNLNCGNSTGPGMGSTMAPGMTPSTMPPVMTPSTKAPAMNPSTTMAPGMSGPNGMMAPLQSFNFLACPILSFFNSVPLVGSPLENSMNPIFGCPQSTSGTR